MKDIVVTISDIRNNQIKLDVNDSEGVTVYKWKSITIADGIKISVEKINKTQVKLAENRDICPYYVQQFLLQRYDIYYCGIWRL